MNIMTLKLLGLWEKILKLEKETQCFSSLKVSGFTADMYSIFENLEINFADIKSCISLSKLNNIIGSTENVIKELIKKRAECIVKVSSK